MDVISWVVGLVAGVLLPLPKALALAAGTSVLIRVYQFFIADTWGDQFPEDLFGAVAMIAVSCLFAYIGSLFKVRRDRRSSQAKGDHA